MHRIMDCVPLILAASAPQVPADFLVAGYYVEVLPGINYFIEDEHEREAKTDCRVCVICR